MPSPSKPSKKGKTKRVWPMGGANTDVGTLDYSSAHAGDQAGGQSGGGGKEDDAYLEQNVRCCFEIDDVVTMEINPCDTQTV